MDRKPKKLRELGEKGYESLGIIVTEDDEGVAYREAYNSTKPCEFCVRCGNQGTWSNDINVSCCSEGIVGLYNFFVLIHPSTGETKLFKGKLTNIKHNADILEGMLEEDFKELLDVMNNDALKTEITTFITEGILLSAK